jgi:hypothetical protein
MFTVSDQGQPRSLLPSVAESLFAQSLTTTLLKPSCGPKPSFDLGLLVSFD